ncbi:hypothetical protein [Streptomyces sp. NPDC087294]|uniref:hypothetical protein n=1 Tax=Streptomyces sp. NPDC087294 TaxID=3365777 RepID=UPI003805882A
MAGPGAKRASGTGKASGKPMASAGGRGKKLTAFNKFMQTELARLKEEAPELAHQERFKLATANWKSAKEKPKAG